MARLSDDFLVKVRMWIELGRHLRTIKMSDAQKKRTAIAFHVFRMWMNDHTSDSVKVIRHIGDINDRTESEIKNDIELLKYFQKMYGDHCLLLNADEKKKYIRGLKEIDISESIDE